MRFVIPVLFAALALFAIPAQADSISDSTIYTFTGDPLLNSGNPGTLLTGSTGGGPLCNCSITGELTFPTPLDLPVGGGLAELGPLTPSSYSFSVDGFTLNQSNSTGRFSLGQLIPCAGCGTDAWHIFITENSNPNNYIISTCDS
jgi:hypothetical protein